MAMESYLSVLDTAYAFLMKKTSRRIKYCYCILDKIEHSNKFHV